MPNRRLSAKIKIGLYCLLLLALFGLTAWYVSSLSIDVLNPKGEIALKQQNLLIFTTVLGLAVIIPVFIMTIAIAWRYREGNTKATYTPNWDKNTLAEVIWWGIPILIIGLLSVITWNSTHELDPHKPLVSDVKPLTIQVVALDWKWLFIYPEHNIATVNYIQVPTDTPINFKITSDATMNSFWIPQLGGQIYAMPGMVTQLHLMASEKGDYKGLSANISGEGFSGMKFIAKATSDTDFKNWITKGQTAEQILTSETYADLKKQSIRHPVETYQSTTPDMYDTIVMTYMMPSADSSHHDMADMEHHTMDSSHQNHGGH